MFRSTATVAALARSMSVSILAAISSPRAMAFPARGRLLGALGPGLLIGGGLRHALDLAARARRRLLRARICLHRCSPPPRRGRLGVGGGHSLLGAAHARLDSAPTSCAFAVCASTATTASSAWAARAFAAFRRCARSRARPRCRRAPPARSRAAPPRRPRRRGALSLRLCRARRLLGGVARASACVVRLRGALAECVRARRRPARQEP